jgi:hypothetical protein
MKILKLFEKNISLTTFHLNYNRLTLILRLFFVILVISDLLFFIYILPQRNFSLADWLWPVSWLPESNSREILFIGAILVTLFHLACALNPFSQWTKAISFLIFFMLVSAFFSFGKVSRYLHGALFCQFWFIWIGKKDSDNDKYFFSAGQASFLMVYLVAGIWKLRNTIYGLLYIKDTEVDHLKYNYALHHIQNYSQDLDWVFDAPAVITHSLWIALIIWEIGIFFIWLKPSWQKWGCASILIFHALTFITFDLPYLPQPLLALPLFCLNAYDHEKYN